MKKHVLTVFIVCLCAMLFCSCSVRSKGSLISYAKSEFGDCEFVKEDVKGSGNDKVRTVYLIDKDTGIEYTVTSTLNEMNLDGSSFGYTEYTSSDFTNLYIDYIRDNARDELDDIEEEYGVTIEDNLGEILFEERPAPGQAEEVARAVDAVVDSYDVKELLELTYLVFAEDGSAYLGVLNGGTDEWSGNNVYDVIDYVQSVFPDAEYKASIYGLPESYVNTEDMERLRKLGCTDEAAYDTEFFFFSDPKYGTLVAFDLEEIGLEGFLITEYDYSIPGDTLDCDALGIHHQD